MADWDADNTGNTMIGTILGTVLPEDVDYGLSFDEQQGGGESGTL